METTITCKRCKECGALIAPTSILCSECEKRLARKPREAVARDVVFSRDENGCITFDVDAFMRRTRQTVSTERPFAEPRAEYVNIDATAVYDWS